MRLNLSPRTLELAHRYWYFRAFLQHEIDQYIGHFLKAPAPIRNQLFNARMALQLNSNQRKFSSQRILKWEKCELKGTISLNSLRKAADAIDCELVYAIRPKQRKRFSEIIWNEILPEAKNHPWVIRRAPQHQYKALQAIASELLHDPEFRRRKGWSERKTISNPSFRRP